MNECCYNCNLWLSDYENCQGMDDLDAKCHEFQRNPFIPKEDWDALPWYTPDVNYGKDNI